MDDASIKKIYSIINCRGQEEADSVFEGEKIFN